MRRELTTPLLPRARRSTRVAAAAARGPLEQVRVWLRRRRLSRYVEPLVALGVESLEDLLDVEPQHLQSIGMKVLQVERFLKVRPCGAAVGVTTSPAWWTLAQ